MANQAKLERIIEAVRKGLDGDAAVEFVCRSGHAINANGIARNLRSMGGRGRIVELIRARKTNVEILNTCLAGMHMKETPIPPTQEELFPQSPLHELGQGLGNEPLYDTTKVTLRIPSELFEAIRLAAKAEGKTQNQLIVDVLTSALSRMPPFPPEEV